MANLSLNSAVVTNGKRLPLGQFWQHVRFMGLLGAFLEEVQELENTITPSIEAFALQNATGWVLNQWGNRVGYPRPAYGPAANSDNSFRVLIYGQIGANTSHGTENDIYNILGALQLTNIRIYDKYPGTMTINYTPNSLTITCACVRSILARATHPVSFDITTHSNGAFGFKGNTLALGWHKGRLGASI